MHIKIFTRRNQSLIRSTLLKLKFMRRSTALMRAITKSVLCFSPKKTCSADHHRPMKTSAPITRMPSSISPASISLRSLRRTPNLALMSLASQPWSLTLYTTSGNSCYILFLRLWRQPPTPGSEISYMPLTAAIWPPIMCSKRICPKPRS